MVNYYSAGYFIAKLDQGLAAVTGEGDLWLFTASPDLALKIGLSANGGLSVPGHQDVRLIINNSLDQEGLLFKGGANSVLLVGGKSAPGQVKVKEETGGVFCTLDGLTEQLVLGSDVLAQARSVLTRNRFRLESSPAFSRIILDASNEANYAHACPLIVRSTNTESGSQSPEDDVFRFYTDFEDRASLRLGRRGGGKAGEIRLVDGGGDTTIKIDGEDGDVYLYNADYAEEFPSAPGAVLLPGEVVSSVLRDAVERSERPYDKRVVGIVSGAGGLRPGIVLDRREGEAGRVPVAIGGKVYCKVDATSCPIDMGDMLVSSATAGHAMKAEDPSRAFGCVLVLLRHKRNKSQHNAFESRQPVRV